MLKDKSIGLVAHDARKQDMLDWVRTNADTLLKHNLVCTGTTGRLIREMVECDFPDKEVTIEQLKSGPLGGDQQMGSLIADGKVKVLFFFTDPMASQPHDVDVKALVRLCSVYNAVLACTMSTADFVINSPLFDSDYKPIVHDYSVYLKREAVEPHNS